MNFILILKELWRRRLLVAISVVAAAMISLVAIYSVSLAPPSISKRASVDAQGSIEILVDSSQSPIADVGRNILPLTARAGVFARYMAGGNVIARIAKDTGIPVNQIDVAGPVPLPDEVPGAATSSPQVHPYGIAVVQRDALPIVNVTTRAPTVPEARDLAAAAPAAVRSVVESIQNEQGISPDKRVEFRALGPAKAAPVADALGAKVAVPMFIVLLAFFIGLILGLPRFIAAWRSAEPDALSPSPYDEESPQSPAVFPAPSVSGNEPDGTRTLVPADDENKVGRQAWRRA